MGAAALTNVTQAHGLNGLRAVTADVVLSSSYATGGDTIPIATLGLRQLYEIWTKGGTISNGPLSKTYTANAAGIQLVLAGTSAVPLLKAFYGSATEVSSAHDNSAVPAVRIEFRGV